MMRIAIVFLDNNPIKHFFTLCFRLLCCKGKVHFIGSSSSCLRRLMKLPLVGAIFKTRFVEFERHAGDYKGLWYKINQETIEYTRDFYNIYIGSTNSIINFCNEIFQTNKFEAFVKKRISYQVFELIKTLYLLKNSGGKYQLLMKKDTLSQYVVSRFLKEHDFALSIKSVSLFQNLILLSGYYIWLIKEIIRRGFCRHERRGNFKLFKESTWGFHRKVLRDDILIDGKLFQKEDILFGEFKGNHVPRKEAFAEAQRRGYNTVSVQCLPINARDRLSDLLYLYLLVPIKLYFMSFGRDSNFLFSYITQFFIMAFPIEILMRFFKIGANISMYDYNDISQTIVFNRFGTKNIIFHWSDLTFYKAYNHAFIAHNTYYTWGDLHYDTHGDTYFVNNKENIGCIYTTENSSDRDVVLRELDIPRDRCIVTFFDSSFNKYIHFSEHFFLSFLDIINEFCKNNPEVSVLLKPKFVRHSYETYLDEKLQAEYRKIWDNLCNLHNFRFLDPIKFDIVEIIEVSSICVTMGLTSPSTIALIMNRDALYFDNTGNELHPFAKSYSGKIVFEEKGGLLKQIRDILDKKVRCHNIVDESLLRKYDAFRDNKALERLKSSLYRLTMD